MIRISVANPYEFPLNFAEIKRVALAVLEGESIQRGKVVIAPVNNEHIHRLNRQFLNHDEPTDVLTFPYTEPGATTLEGEIVVGYEVAAEYAQDRGHDPQTELLLYVIHGCLHLCGYDDTSPQARREMRAKEHAYLQALNLPDIAGDDEPT